MAKYNLIFTLDYEIYGNGEGDPMVMMVEPTGRLMNLLEKYHQRVTIMADVAEILCFKRYLAETGRDDYHVAEIEAQLKEAVRRGHDVQLHVHSSYFKAKHNGVSFDQCMEEYNMAILPHERIDEMIGECVAYLEGLLKPNKKDYKVWLFRAANWSMMPTEGLYRALVKHGVTHDTSVYKGGCEGGLVCCDYRNAYDNLLAYPASVHNINEYDAEGKLTELPIYTEMRPFWDFISPIRIMRMIRNKMHKFNKPKGENVERVKSLETEARKNDNRHITLKSFFVKSPLKMDFNQVNARGLKRMMKNIDRRVRGERLAVSGKPIDVVLIGHSKTFVPYNEKILEPFLKWFVKQETK